MTIGLLPAAGSAARMSGLPKFLLPIPGGTLLNWHCQRMEAAGVEEIALGYSESTVKLLHKNTTPNTFLYSGGRTLAHTIANAHIITGDADVVFGMPDTYFTDADAYRKVTDGLDGADIAVGVFATRPEQRHKLGMVRIEADHVVEVIDKPTATHLIYAWGMIAWKPTFWQHIYPIDATVGDALPRAIRAGLTVRAVPLDGMYYDCGTPDEYFQLIREVTQYAAP